MNQSQNISYRKNVKSSLSLPTRIDYMKPLQSYISGLCDIHGCEEKDVYMISLAVEEAVSNVIQHGYSSDKEGSFNISFDVGPAGLTVEIHEKGLPFDPQTMASYGEKPASEDSLDLQHGVGLRLMKGAMDRVEFLNLGKSGKLVRMSKYFRHGRIDRFLSKDELYRSTEDDAIKDPCSIERLKMHNALEVSRCAYSAYGYTYREFIYYPEKIWEMNERGQLLSFVLVDSVGKLLGHLGLSFSAPGAVIAEMAAAFVNPCCRGRGFLGELVNTVIDKAQEMDLEGVFVHAVTSHNASQKGALRAGLLPTGLLLAALFSDLEFKALTGEVTQKENALLMFRQLKSRPPFKVWVPTRYSHVIKELSHDIGREVIVCEEKVSLPLTSNGEGNRYYRVEEFNFSEIRISSYSEDVFKNLKHRVHGFIKDHVDVVYLYLDMECPEAGIFADRCREMGFFFCGYMPGEMNGRDALILQRLNDIVVDFSALKLVNSSAADMVKFIENDMPEEEL